MSYIDVQLIIYTCVHARLENDAHLAFSECLGGTM